MSSATATWGNILIVRSSTSASNEVTWDTEKERRMVAKVVACVVPEIAAHTRRGVVVELKPRTFTETASHFLNIAKPVAWPHDEADID
ncbi:MAG: hypothetical protein WBE70_03640 [Candidatus Acidiferrum sp.]